MNQMTLLPQELPWIMISLKPEYIQMILRGEKKYEYRRGILYKEACHALIYSSSPQMSLFFYAKLGEPVIAPREEISQLRESEGGCSYEEMMAYLEGAKQCSATPILEYKKFKEIDLYELRQLKEGFHPPQRVTYLKEGDPILCEVKKRLNF